MFSAYNPRASNAYQRINVETSMHTMDQHQLVNLLLQGAISAIATARGALNRDDVLLKCNSVTKAIRIIDEGLNTALDREDGGELAVNLGNLYDYCIRRLITANARNDDAMLLEVQRLIEPIAVSWSAIKNGGAAPSAEPAFANQRVLMEA